jgi:hypothetical protein
MDGTQADFRLTPLDMAAEHAEVRNADSISPAVLLEMKMDSDYGE